MKNTNIGHVLRFVALGLSIASLVCLIVAFWGRILDALDTLSDKIEERRSAHLCQSEYDDFEDGEFEF